MTDRCKECGETCDEEEQDICRASNAYMDELVVILHNAMEQFGERAAFTMTNTVMNHVFEDIIIEMVNAMKQDAKIKPLSTMVH